MVFSRRLQRRVFALFFFMVAAAPIRGRAENPPTPLRGEAQSAVAAAPFAVGSNAFGQLGNATGADSTLPVAASGMTNIIAVAGGGFHTLALRGDGTVWAWGRNREGQLGDGTTIDRATPVQVSGLVNVVSIAAGGTHSLALDSQGSVWAWGSGRSGENGKILDVSRASIVILDAVAIGAGSAFSAAVLRDGRVLGWGAAIPSGKPPGLYTVAMLAEASLVTDVSGAPLSGVVSIACGAGHTVALKADGTVWTWGTNAGGQLTGASVPSSGGADFSFRASDIPALSNVESIAAGDRHSLAIVLGGAVWAWGGNPSGQLGAAPSPFGQPPAPIAGLTDVRAIAAGSGHSLALTGDGRVWGWGSNAAGEIGNAPAGATPSTIAGVNGVVAIAAGRSHSLLVAPRAPQPVVTIRPNDVTRKYGASNPSFAATFAGFINGDDPSVLNGTLACATTATAASPVGRYPIFCVGVSDEQYDVLYADGVLTVEPALLTVTADDKTRGIGDANPTLTVTYSGFVNGETALAVLSGAPAVFTNARSSSPAGAYPINVSINTLEATNYAFLPVAGQLIVTTPIDAATGRRTVYQNTVDEDFAIGLGGEWSFTGSASSFHAGALNTDNAPNGRRFIGQFSNDTASLTLRNLPAHTSLTVAFDLLLFNSWDGDGGASEQWGLRVGGKWITLTTFSNSPYAGHLQSYPALFGPNGSPRQAYAGAVASGPGALGYSAWDSVYRLQYTFAHTGDTITVDFTGVGLTPGYADESWGLDDIKIDIGNEPVSVSGWGANAWGQVGAGPGGVMPQGIITGDGRTIALAGGDAHTLALNADGTVSGWGRNDVGQIGSRIDGPTAQRLAGLDKVIGIAAGAGHSLALKSDGTVWGWGSNDHGQVGLGTGGAGPRPVVAIDRAMAIAASHNHSLALKSDGTVWGWGQDGDLPITTGTTNGQLVFFPGLPFQIPSLNRITAIATGDAHALALRDDGTVWAWGTNSSGQTGAHPSSSFAQQIPGLVDIVAIAAGNGFSLALDSHGTLWGLGTGAGLTSEPFNGVVKQIPAPSDLVAIAAGNDHALALRRDGTVWGVGTDSAGQIGASAGDASDSASLRQVDGASNVTSLTAGAFHSLAITGRPFVTVQADHKIRSYGAVDPPFTPTLRYHGGSHAALNGTLACTSTATPASGVGRYPINCAGLSSTEYDVVYLQGAMTIVQAVLSIKADDKTRSLGEENPALTVTYTGFVNGDGPSVLPGPPVLTTTPDITSPAGPYPIVVTLPPGGAANYVVQLVNGTMTVASLPGSLPGGRLIYRDGFESGISNEWSNRRFSTTPSGQPFLGEYGWETTTLAIQHLPPHVTATISFDLYILRSWDGYGNACCGEEWQLDMSGGGPALIRTRFSNTGDVGNFQSYPAWSGQGTFPEHTGAVEVNTLGYSPWGDAVYRLQFTVPHADDSIAFNFTGFNLQATTDESWGLDNVRVEVGSTALFGWGRNDRGQIGANPLTLSQPAITSLHSPFVAFAAGDAHSLALRADGTVWGLGDNRDGQLGSEPGGEVLQQIPGFNDIVDIAAAGSYSLLLKSDGTVWGLGRSDTGVVGSAASETPQQVEGLFGVVAISAGTTHALALTSDGLVWGWGSNLFGEIGANARGAVGVPFQRIGGLANVVAIATGAGSRHSVAVRADGSVWGWGLNDSGQIGTGAGGGVPSPITGIGNATAAATGEAHTLVLTRDGHVWGLGSNEQGQLGVAGGPSPKVMYDSFGVGIGASARHSTVMSVQGLLLGWGDNTDGVIGLDPGGSSPRTLKGPWGEMPVRDVLVAGAGPAHTLGFASVSRFLVQPRRLDFTPQVVRSDSAGQTLFVTNLGSVPNTIQNIAVTRGRPSFYKIESDSCSGTTLEPGATCIVRVQFTPQAVGFYLAALAITDAEGHVATAWLSGTGIKRASAVAASPATGVFGGTARLSATLQSGGFGLAGKQIAFVLNGRLVGTATTDAAGVASLENVSLAGINAGTYARAIHAVFDGDPEYLSAFGDELLTVTRATPAITWPAPAPIVYGTALTTSQLNASTDVPGSFRYSPVSETVLHAGAGQPLSVTFAPADTANYNDAVAATTIDVTPAQLTIKANDATKVFGAPMPAFTATATGFVNGDTIDSLTGALAFSTAATATAPAGAYAVTPAGLTSSDYAIAYSSGTLTIERASTTTTVTSSANPASFGQPIAFTATVSGVAPGAGVPGGTVEFLDGTLLLGAVTPVNGAATLTTTLASGVHTIVARYSGDTNFIPSTASIGETVNGASASTTTVLESTPNPSLVSEAVTLTATVTTLAGNGVPLGTVTFFDSASGTPIGSSPVGRLKGKDSATLIVTLPAVLGTHTLTASYSGDTVFGPSTSAPVAQTVYSGPAPRETKTTMTVPIAVNQGVSFTVATQVAAAKGKKLAISGDVRLSVDGATAGTTALDATGQAAFTVAPLPPGIHTIVVQYLGDAAQAFAASVSAPAPVLIR